MVNWYNSPSDTVLPRAARPATAPAAPVAIPRGWAALLLTLRRTPERTRQAIDQLSALPLPLTIIWAKDGRDAEFMATAPTSPDCAMQAGEVGLSATWLAAAAHIVRHNLAGALVFEDDAEQCRAGVLDALALLPADIDFALLHDAAIPTPTLSDGHTEDFLRVLACSWQTTAVFLSHAGARKMLSAMLPIRQAIDVFFRASGMIGYQCRSGHGFYRQSFLWPSTVRENGGAGAIPQCIHQIWIGGELPAEFAEYAAAWRKLHPGWQYRLWTGEEIASEFPEAIGAETPAEQSDIARLLILQKYGGLYADTDFEPFRNFDPAVSSAAFLVGWMDAENLANGFLASVPGGKIVNGVVALMRSRLGCSGSLLWRAGPAMLKDALAPWMQAFPKISPGLLTAYGDTGLCALMPHVLFPYTWTQLRPDSYPSSAWAAHHWARSWWTAEMWKACPALV